MANLSTKLSTMYTAEVKAKYPSTTLSFFHEKGDNKFTTAEEIEPLASKIEATECVEVLELGGNSIGEEAGKRLARAISKHPELKYLIWDDIFRTRLKTEIPGIMQSLSDAMMMNGTQLTHLNLADNAFGPVGIEGIKDLLKSSVCHTLEYINLNNGGWGISSRIIAKCLIECHASSVQAGRPMALKTFIVGRSRFEESGAVHIAKFFKIVGTLEFVAMPQNGIYYKGVTALAKSFAHNPNLRYIDISDNTMGRQGSAAFADALKVLTSLEVLNLNDCLLRNSGMALLVDVLRHSCPKLKELSVTGNELTVANAHAVLELARNKPHLATVNMGENGYGEQFEHLSQRFTEAGFSDALGAESDDEGTADEEDLDAEDNAPEQYNEDTHSDGEEAAGEKTTKAFSFANVSVCSPTTTATPPKTATTPQNFFGKSLFSSPAQGNPFAFKTPSVKSPNDSFKTAGSHPSVTSPSAMRDGAPTPDICERVTNVLAQVTDADSLARLGGGEPAEYFSEQLSACLEECLTEDMTSCTRLCDLMAESFMVIGGTIQQGHLAEHVQTETAQACISSMLATFFEHCKYKYGYIELQSQIVNFVVQRLGIFPTDCGRTTPRPEAAHGVLTIVANLVRHENYFKRQLAVWRYIVLGYDGSVNVLDGAVDAVSELLSAMDYVKGDDSPSHGSKPTASIMLS